MQPFAFDVTGTLLLLLGAFYMFAGVVAARAAKASYVFDRMIAAIGGDKPARAETVQSFWLMGASFLVLAGGAALLLLLDIAAWLFLASALGQVFYLTVLAPHFFDADNPPDPKGRRATFNATILYSAATAFVGWAAVKGKLYPVTGETWPLTMAAATAIAAFAAYTLWEALRPVARTPASVPSDDT